MVMKSRLAASGGIYIPTYVDDVFSTFTDPGNTPSQYTEIGINLAGSSDAFSGEVLTYSGNKVDISSILIDSNGNSYELYATGASGSYTELVKKSSTGTILWTRTISEGGRAQARQVKVLPNGNVAVLSYANRSTFDYYTIIVTYDPLGNIQWHRGIENGAEYTQGNFFDFDSNSNIYILGSSGGNYNFISFHKIDTTGNFVFQKRIYETTSYYANPLSMQVDGTDVWICMNTQSAEGGGYWGKLIKLDTSGNLLYKKTFTNLNSALVDSTYIYATTIPNNDNYQGSILKINKSDLSIVAQQSYTHAAGINPVVLKLYGGFIWVRLSTGVFKFDSNLNIKSAIHAEMRQNITGTSPVDLNIGFGNSKIYFASAYTGTDSFIATANIEFSQLIGNINSVFFLDKLVLYSSNNITPSITNDTRLSYDNDSCSISNSTATYGVSSTISLRTAFSCAAISGSATNDVLLWFKRRDTSESHLLTDSVTGFSKGLSADSPNAQFASGTASSLSYIKSVTATGFIKNTSHTKISQGSNVAWAFKKAAKFLDIVTYTGDGTGTANVNFTKTINHNLGIVPGMILIKATSSTDSWYVWHRSLVGSPMGAGLYQPPDDNIHTPGLILNSFRYAGYVSSDNVHNVTSSSFKVANFNGLTNQSGVSYVAYVFAHDTSADGMIQCGSFVDNASGTSKTTVNLGWEPQFILSKESTRDNIWHLLDTTRGMESNGYTSILFADSSSTESYRTYQMAFPSASGFTWNTGQLTESGNTVIYLAVRKSNKPPSVSTEVFKPISGNYLPTAYIHAGFSIDMYMRVQTSRANQGNFFIHDNLRGFSKSLTPNDTQPNADVSGNTSVKNGNGINAENGGSYFSNLHLFFKRATGFFDVVYYTETGTYPLMIPHSLGVVPDLFIFKVQNATSAWDVWDGTYQMSMDSGNTPAGSANFLGNKTATTFQAPGYASGRQLIVYLFATLKGISKVGSYTGNGGNQTIACGFTTGARFILIKRTSSSGDWFLWDSSRGIVGANDPHLSLNTSVPDVTNDNSVDPNNSGFIVNQISATNINVTNATYFFLAIA